AEGIVNVCKFYVESPLACVSGVTGSDLKRRIAAIMINRVGVQLDLVRRLSLMTTAALAIALPLVAGMITAPLRISAFAQTSASAAGAASARQTSAGPPFDVVSIKPCDAGPGHRVVARVPPTPGFRGAGATTAQTSPGYVYWDCISLQEMIEQAYV